MEVKNNQEKVSNNRHFFFLTKKTIKNDNFVIKYIMCKNAKGSDLNE